MTMRIYKLRDEFEAWIGHTSMLSKKEEPGYTDDYIHPWTQGAWAAWKECHERMKPNAPEPLTITKEQWEDATRGLGTKA